MGKPTRLAKMVDGPGPDLGEIADYLDGLEHPERLAETRSLGRKSQRRLFDAARGFRTVRVGDIVPEAMGSLEEVVHHGKNTLPAFSHFKKVFCRPAPEPDSGELWGYNRNSGLIETTVGPGYYVAYDYRDDEVLVDYLRTPPSKPDAWPAIVPNSKRLSRLVYYQTQDVLRRVSEHVNIGRATRNNKPMSAWFVLCREDRA